VVAANRNSMLHARTNRTARPCSAINLATLYPVLEKSGCNSFRDEETENRSGTKSIDQRFSNGIKTRHQSQQENTMGSTTDKIKGMANEATGNIKQGIGKAVGNDKMRVEGAIQERKGEAQQAVGKAKDAVKKVVDGA
jgi:uncharacterized protein YjbJ (UPF0337 family)